VWGRVQIRQLAVESALLNAADGSARWSQDATTVIAAVNGPRQVPAYKVPNPLLRLLVRS
jgi:ribonuclease PH